MKNLVDGTWVQLHFAYNYAAKQAVGFFKSADGIKKGVMAAE